MTILDMADTSWKPQLNLPVPSRPGTKTTATFFGSRFLKHPDVGLL
jgi:hypothetical protein